MKQFKYLLIAFFALSLTASVNAQTTKSKKAKTTKTTTHAHAAKYQCPMKCEGDKTYDHARKCPVCNMKLNALPKDATAATYQCPMKCEGEKTYAKEGKCPVCNMKLKKMDAKKTTDPDGHNIVKITDLTGVKYLLGL